MRRVNEVRRDIIRWLWHVVRLPIVMFLVILEPVVALTCGALALLGVLTTVFFKLIAAPHFPTWTMLIIDAADIYAEIAASRRMTGKPISQFDAMVVAMARSRGATLATRNVIDFEDCGVEVIDPWTA